ncbi:MAG: sigma 54-interacting transcriptional regulator [Gemmataceae bacterium]
MSADGFRWRGFFQHSSDAIFVLNRSRKLVFANRAFETLSGVSLADARGMTCTRRASGHSHASLGRTLAPPSEAVRGEMARATRPRPGEELGPPWWEIEYLPLADADGMLGIVGRVTQRDRRDLGASRVMPESWAAVREDAVHRYRLDAIADTCPAMRTAIERARLAAQSNATVAIVGEPGTGKRWLARAIHLAGRRSALPFVALDCSALPFDAVHQVLRGPLGPDHPEWLGTLYLQAADRLPEPTRESLLEHLTERGDQGFGFIAGYDTEPDNAIGILPIRLPALRERATDLPWLVEFFVKRAATALNRKPPLVASEASECLGAYSWPRNLRELAETLFAAVTTAGDRIEPHDLPLAIRQARSDVEVPLRRQEPMPRLDEVLERVEKRLIALAIERADGNQTKAAEMLGVWRPRLVRRIKALGLDSERLE